MMLHARLGVSPYLGDDGPPQQVPPEDQKSELTRLREPTMRRLYGDVPSASR
jgi:hypothetical protein